MTAREAAALTGTRLTITVVVVVEAGFTLTWLLGKVGEVGFIGVTAVTGLGTGANVVVVSIGAGANVVVVSIGAGANVVVVSIGAGANVVVVSTGIGPHPPSNPPAGGLEQLFEAKASVDDSVTMLSANNSNALISRTFLTIKSFRELFQTIKYLKSI
jgi:hypothetical protein